MKVIKPYSLLHIWQRVVTSIIVVDRQKSLAIQLQRAYLSVYGILKTAINSTNYYRLT